MKTSLATLVLSVTIFGSAGVASASPDRWETLRAINWVENPHNHHRQGRHGELGPYQFRPATWSMHTARPFSQAVNRGAADEVAVKHYEWIKHSLERGKVEPTPFNIAMAWNCGVTAVVSGRAPQASYRYAVRVTNLVDVLRERSDQAVVEQLPQAASEAERVRSQNVDVPTFRFDESEDQSVMSAAVERFRVFAGDKISFVVVAN